VGISGRLWPFFLRVLEYVWFPAFGGAAVCPGRMPVIKKWQGQRKSFRQEADVNRMVAVWLTGG